MTDSRLNLLQDDQSWLTRFFRDPRGRLFYRSRYYQIQISQFFCTIFANLLLRSMGVHVGSGCRFVGIPLVSRYPYSSISLGQNSFLRSDSKSNLVGINHRCILSTFGESSTIRIGSKVGMSGAVIGALESVSIGDNVLLGANSIITDFDWHDPLPFKRRLSRGKSKPVVIGNNVWIGLNVLVLKGVCIGDNSVIGANSVVTKYIPENVLAVGNPCKVVKELETLE
jgi:acetyltransferase-like isoleucine patch superfamily enzyme